MGLLRKTATVRAAAASSEPFRKSHYVSPEGYMLPGIYDGLSYPMSPELAMRLSYVHAAVDIIGGDFGTCPAGIYSAQRNKVRFSDPGLGQLAYRIRWQPNLWQTGKAFWSTMAHQYLLRRACYAEVVYRPGSDALVEQLVPRHPDRVREVRLSSGEIAYQLSGEPGGPRMVTPGEMFVVRNTSTDGLNAISRTQYGAATLSTALTLQRFTQVYFRKGITGSLLASYKGSQAKDEWEAALHASITRFVGGAENAGGVLVLPEDISVKELGVDPEKAQLLGLKDLNGRDIARLFKIPPHKLGIGGTVTYASQVQSAQDYVITCQMPIVREMQDAVYVYLILSRDHFAKFNTEHLTQADRKTRMEAHEVAIRARVYRPSTAREMEDLPEDEELDRLSALDHRAGNQRDGQGNTGNMSGSRAAASVRLVLVTHDGAQRVVRRERAAVEKLAKKYSRADQVQDWRRELAAFYEDHARFTADTMRIPDLVARAYAAQHGQSIEDRGVGVMTDGWERLEAEALAELALEPEAVGRLVFSEGVAHAA